MSRGTLCGVISLKVEDWIKKCNRLQKYFVLYAILVENVCQGDKNSWKYTLHHLLTVNFYADEHSKRCDDLRYR
jgi:hypothetical protein